MKRTKKDLYERVKLLNEILEEKGVDLQGFEYHIAERDIATYGSNYSVALEMKKLESGATKDVTYFMSVTNLYYVINAMIGMTEYIK